MHVLATAGRGAQLLVLAVPGAGLTNFVALARRPPRARTPSYRRLVAAAARRYCRGIHVL
eukprot:COSAG02_NODE_15141_length_1200_cov_1.386013_1_plen_59_part_10